MTTEIDSAKQYEEGLDSHGFQQEKQYHPSNPLHRYNLPRLEDDCRESYRIWSEKKEVDIATYNMYMSIKNLCFAVAQLTSIPRQHVNRKEVSDNEAVYILGLILRGKLVPVGTWENKRFPWKNYVMKTIRYFIPYPGKDTGHAEDYLNVRWENFTRDREVWDTNTDIRDDKADPELIVSRKYLRRKIIEGLRLYYPEDQLKRHFHLFCSLCTCMKEYPAHNPNVPYDMQIFSIRVLAIAGRVVEQINPRFIRPSTPTHLTEAVQSALGSSMFMSAVLEDSVDFPKELFMCLDYDSLYRLCQCAGDKIIKIPSSKKLHSVVQAVRTAVEMLTTGWKREDTDSAIHQPCHLPGRSAISMNPLITKLLQHYSIFGKAPTEGSKTMHSILTKQIQGLDALIQRILTNSVQDSQVVHAYSELNYTLMNILKVLAQYNRGEDTPALQE